MIEDPAPGRGDTRTPEPRARGAATSIDWRRVQRLVRRALHRAMDLMIAIVALALLAPLLVVVAVLVKADGPGPVLHRREHVGRGGRTSQLVTFRTTTNGSDLTRLGTTLRRYAIDEYPLLWNVLRGDVSLIVLRRTAQTVTRPVGA